MSDESTMSLFSGKGGEAAIISLRRLFILSVPLVVTLATGAGVVIKGQWDVLDRQSELAKDFGAIREQIKALASRIDDQAMRVSMHDKEIADALNGARRIDSLESRLSDHTKAIVDANDTIHKMVMSEGELKADRARNAALHDGLEDWKRQVESRFSRVDTQLNRIEVAQDNLRIQHDQMITFRSGPQQQVAPGLPSGGKGK